MRIRFNGRRIRHIEIETMHWVKFGGAVGIGTGEFVVHLAHMPEVAMCFIVLTVSKDVWESVEVCGRRCQELRRKVRG